MPLLPIFFPSFHPSSHHSFHSSPILIHLSVHYPPYLYILPSICPYLPIHLPPICQLSTPSPAIHPSIYPPIQLSSIIHSSITNTQSTIYLVHVHPSIIHLPVINLSTISYPIYPVSTRHPSISHPFTIHHPSFAHFLSIYSLLIHLSITRPSIIHHHFIIYPPTTINLSFIYASL